MSSGPFLRSFYELNNGEIAAIRVQPETVNFTVGGVANAAPAGPATVPGSASVGRGRRSNGINARLVRFVFTTAPSGYEANSPIALPWLQETAFDDIRRGDPVSYLGGTGVVIGTTSEKIN